MVNCAYNIGGVAEIADLVTWSTSLRYLSYIS